MNRRDFLVRSSMFTAAGLLARSISFAQTPKAASPATPDFKPLRREVGYFTARGGTIDGVIEGLNRILDLAVAEFRTEGGTLIIPGHGRISDSADVAYYRDMVTIIRDRVQAMKARGMTLAQVKASRPTADYDPRYGSTSGGWTTDRFVDAVYATVGK